MLDEFTNAVLVREPARVIASLDATLHADFPVTITGLPQQVRVVEHELAAGRTPIVIDAGDLLAEPAALLTALCRAVDLEFDVAMLHWPAGPKPEDGVWAKHWYHAVHRSTGFVDPPAGTVELSETQQRLLEECRPLYERLLAHRLAGD